MSPDLEPLHELARRVDLAALVARYAGTGRPAGRNVLYLCPGPDHADRHPSFTVSDGPEGQRWRCWSQCARGGDALDLVAWLEGLDIGEAATWLRRYLGDPDNARTSRKSPTSSKPTRTPLAPLPENDRPPAEAGARLLADYLASRGWPAQAAELYGLEVYLIGKARRPAVRHPFFVPTSAGEVELSSWQDRLLHHDPHAAGPKWLAPPGRPLPLWNVVSLEADDLAAVVIAEGPADGTTADLALHHRRDVAVVAVAGSEGWRSSWAQYLAGLRVVIATDNDTAGEKLAEKIAADLEGLAPVSLVVLPDGVNDLTDLGRTSGLEAVRELLELHLPAPPPEAPRGVREEPTTSPAVEPSRPGEVTWEVLDLFTEYRSEPEPTPTARTGPACPTCSAPSSGPCQTCQTAEAGGPHRWRTCSACGRAALAPVGSRCLLTPSCEGRYAHTEELAA